MTWNSEQIIQKHEEELLRYKKEILILQKKYESSEAQVKAANSHANEYRERLIWLQEVFLTATYTKTRLKRSNDRRQQEEIDHLKQTIRRLQDSDHLSVSHTIDDRVYQVIGSIQAIFDDILGNTRRHTHSIDLDRVEKDAKMVLTTFSKARMITNALLSRCTDLKFQKMYLAMKVLENQKL
jgi:hypothetical protein